jgi:hypothetical protein
MAYFSFVPLSMTKKKLIAFHHDSIMNFANSKPDECRYAECRVVFGFCIDYIVK